MKKQIIYFSWHQIKPGSYQFLAKYLKDDIAALLDLIENDKPGVAKK